MCKAMKTMLNSRAGGKTDDNDVELTDLIKCFYTSSALVHSSPGRDNMLFSWSCEQEAAFTKPGLVPILGQEAKTGMQVTWVLYSGRRALKDLSQVALHHT